MRTQTLRRGNDHPKDCVLRTKAPRAGESRTRRVATRARQRTQRTQREVRGGCGERCTRARVKGVRRRPMPRASADRAGVRTGYSPRPVARRAARDRRKERKGVCQVHLCCTYA